MSSTAGEIYVSETICDTCRDKLNDLFGEYEWMLVSAYNYICRLDELPDHMEIEVQDIMSGELIGRLFVDNDFYVENMGFHRRVAAKPIIMRIEEIE